MSDLQPFLLIPEFHERIWGTHDLRPIYTRAVGDKPIGEAWLTGESCKVASGPFAGQRLGSLCHKYGAALTGNKANPADRFPLLIKFLFPHEKLSVQVHPDDKRAREMGQPWGKTECWYVASAEPGAKVGVGLKPGTTKDQLEAAIHAKHAEHLLNWIDVCDGDMIYVDAGTVHAIGPGAILIEAQQNSDTTFRLYDYGRPRELHVENGLAATKELTHAGKVRPKVDGSARCAGGIAFLPCRKIYCKATAGITSRRGRRLRADCRRSEGFCCRALRRNGVHCLHAGRSRCHPCAERRIRSAATVGMRVLAYEFACAPGGGAGYNLDMSKSTKPSFYPVILAGGRGTRFWPLSRKRLAKQLLPLNSKKSMIQETVERLAPLSEKKKFWVITNDDLLEAIASQLRGLPRQATDCRAGRSQHCTGDWAGRVYPRAS